MGRILALIAVLMCMGVVLQWHWWGVLALWFGTSFPSAAYMLMTTPQRTGTRERPAYMPVRATTPPPPPPAPAVYVAPPAPVVLAFDPELLAQGLSKLRAQAAERHSGVATHCMGCGAPVAIAADGVLVAPPGHFAVRTLADPPSVLRFLCPEDGSYSVIQSRDVAPPARPYIDPRFPPDFDD